LSALDEPNLHKTSETTSFVIKHKTSRVNCNMPEQNRDLTEN